MEHLWSFPPLGTTGKRRESGLAELVIAPVPVHVVRLAVVDAQWAVIGGAPRL